MSHVTRRVVTGHDDNGNAIIESDGAAPNVRVREGAGFVSTLLWVTDETPAKVDLRIDRADRTIAVAPPANGSILRIVDFPPVTPEVDSIDGVALRRAMGVDHGGAAGTPSRHAYMHRTKSVDYGIVLSGEIACCWTIRKFISRPAISSFSRRPTTPGSTDRQTSAGSRSS
jgi:hypothetical protein